MAAEAQRYCALIEAAPESDMHGFGLSVARALADVLSAANALPDDFHDGPDPPDIPRAEWQERFEALNRTFGDRARYWSTFDPYDDGEPAGSRSLSDDLADIWHDLTQGLRALDAGHAPAGVVWDWRCSFQTHWGRHAIWASQALHGLVYG